MRKRFLAIALVVSGTFGGLAVSAGPAAANHVRQPACDIFRQTLISAQTALNNANQELATAETAYTNALINLTLTSQQLIDPTLNLIQAHENNVGIATAEAAFNTALSNFNQAVDQYVAALTNLTEVEATRDVNQAVIPYLEGVIVGLDALEGFACPNPIAP